MKRFCWAGERLRVGRHNNRAKRDCCEGIRVKRKKKDS